MSPEGAIILVPAITGIFTLVGTLLAKRDRRRLGDNSSTQHAILLGHMIQNAEAIADVRAEVGALSKDMVVVKSTLRKVSPHALQVVF